MKCPKCENSEEYGHHQFIAHWKKGHGLSSMDLLFEFYETMQEVMEEVKANRAAINRIKNTDREVRS